MDVSLAACKDVEQIKSVFTNPDIWATIAEDNQSPSRFSVDFEKEMYVSVTAKQVLIGFYAIRAVNGIEIDLHAQILPEHRKEYALASGEAILKWIYTELPAVLKVTAQIPFCFPNVKDFAIKQGLQIEGVNRQSYRKSGKILDQWYLGITRDEIGVKYELG